MFDDLHDPNPPTAGMDALAAVTRRAQHIRRRRSAVLGSIGIAVVALSITAYALPGRDRAGVAPADSVATSPLFGDGPVPDCGVLTDPVWLPNGDLPGTPEAISGIDPFTGERVDGRTWLSPDGFGLLVQLPTTADVPALPTSGRMWGLRVRDARPAADSVEVTIWRRAGNCAARYLVPGDVESGEEWGASFVDQLTAAAAAAGPYRDTDGVCPVILGERVACIATTSIQPGAMLGPVAGTFVRLGASDPTDEQQMLEGVGVVHVVVGAGDTLSPQSRLAFESPIEGTDLKSVVDLVPLRDVWCGGVRRSDGNLALFELQASPADGDAGDRTTADVRCDDPSDGAPSSTISSTTIPPASTSTTVAAATSAPTSGASSPIVAIDANGDGVVFRESAVPSVVIDDSDPDDSAPPDNPSVFDHVVAMPDGSGYVVGGCCEAPNGYLLIAEPPNTSGRYLADGRLPAATAAGDLIWATLDGVVLGDVDGSIATTLLELDPSEWTVQDLAVVQRESGLEEVLVLASGPDGTSLIRVFAGGGDMRLTQRISDATGVEAAQLSLAGWREDAFYVLDGTNDRMLAFGAEDLQPTSSDVRTSEGEVVGWRSAWLTPTLPRHVEENGELWVGDSSWGGDYRWVR